MKNASTLFKEIIQSDDKLPAEIHSYLENAQNIEECIFDSSYLEFLKIQIELEPRGPEWTAILKHRLENLKPYSNILLIRGTVCSGDCLWTVRVDPESKQVVHWEKDDYPYPHK